MHRTRLLQFDFGCKKAADRMKTVKKSVFKASFDPLRRIFLPQAQIFGVQRFTARSRMRRDDRDRMRSRRGGREVRGEEEGKTQVFSG